MSMTPLHIRARSHDYRVVFCEGFAEAVDVATREGPVAVLADAWFSEHPTIVALRERVPVRSIVADEQAKSFSALEAHFQWLLAQGFRRDHTIVAIGGGVIQDIACFIASTLQRGVRWTLIPTTLLAQCDSCIGSKSSINLGPFKNQLGTFYPPHTVWMSHDVLETLPPDEIRSGLGEAIKLHLLDGETSLARLEAWLKVGHGADGRRDAGSSGVNLPEIVAACLTIKKPFIEEDEFDRGRRNLLNYGHTFGHAFESVTAHAIPHGIAVGLGMLAATFTSVRLGLVDASHLDRVQRVLRPCVTPFEELLRIEDLDRIVTAMQRDKKNKGDRVTCILTRGPGQMEKVVLEVDNLRETLEQFLNARCCIS